MEELLRIKDGIDTHGKTGQELRIRLLTMHKDAMFHIHRIIQVQDGHGLSQRLMIQYSGIPASA